jgi:hypothetical protein
MVTYASVTSGKATQYIAGPFDLGRPRGCAKSLAGAGSACDRGVNR